MALFKRGLGEGRGAGTAALARERVLRKFFRVGGMMVRG